MIATITKAGEHATIRAREGGTRESQAPKARSWEGRELKTPRLVGRRCGGGKENVISLLFGIAIR